MALRQEGDMSTTSHLRQADAVIASTRERITPAPKVPPAPAERAPMVGWYDPSQLLQTAPRVLTSTVFGQNADHRLIEALFAGTTDAVCDYRQDDAGKVRDEIWMDYVSDTGDGWDSTYTIASVVAQPTLSLNDATGRSHPTQRGKVLIFGGDEVYPTASRDEYARRLVAPYETALHRTAAPNPHVFAVPGNHDWYDNLVSFTRLFCSKQWFAGWQAPQSRSYFALRLPHGWWLIGTDVQLGSDIDGPQVEYFNKVAADMQDGDRVILCNAEPHWIYAHIYGEYNGEVYNESNLRFLEEKVFKRRISVFLAGDLHHYRRHAADDGTQKITAGGGGAFLHPTSGPNVDELEGGYALKASFPDAATCKRLCWRNLLFPLQNWAFGVLPAVLYTLTAWASKARVGHQTSVISALGEAVHAVLSDPFAAFWVIALFFGFLLFTDTHSKSYRWIMGSTHGATHLLAAFLLGWGASYLTVSGLGFTEGSTPQLLLGALLMLVGGWLVGPFILGVYLLISLNLFGRHQNEAFSSLAIADWKSFLRLHIGPTGDLTIYPVGIRRVPRRWKASPRPDGPRLLADDPDATAPELIENPIVVNHGLGK
jgi:calcineurin-like phosphoesterase family protein